MFRMLRAPRRFTGNASKIRRAARKFRTLEIPFGTVFMVGDEASLIDGVERLEPSVTVVDLALAGGNRLQLLRRLRERSPRSKLIVRSMYDEFFIVRAAMAAGANG